MTQPIFLRVDPDSATPIYAQIVQGVVRAAAAGRLQVGDRLSSVRALAVELGVNLNTVARAYRQLAAMGVVESRRGRGVFVATGALADTARLTLLDESLRRVVREARELDLDPEAVVARLQTLWRES